jgi:hypothetical protein
MTSLVRSIVFTAILTALTSIAVQAGTPILPPTPTPVPPAVSVPATAPVGVGATPNQVLYSQPFCDDGGQLSAAGPPIPRGIYKLGSDAVPFIPLLPHAPNVNCRAENYAALSFGTGGFTAGDLFVFDLSQGPGNGRIVRSAGGVGPFLPFGSLTFFGDHVGPNFDRVGTFGFNLLVTGNLGVTGLDAAGNLTFFIPSPDPASELENSRIAPLSFAPCPGCMFLVTSPDSPPALGAIWVVKPGTTTPVFFATGPVSPETIIFPEANACTTPIKDQAGVVKNIEYLQAGFTKLPEFSDKYSQAVPPYTQGSGFGAILGWTDDQLKPFIGKFLVPDEFSGKIFVYNGPNAQTDPPTAPNADVFADTGYGLEGAATVACPPGKLLCQTASPGFWKNHPEAWPVDLVLIGGVVYTKDQAIALMKLPKNGDSRLIAFFQLVSYRLNLASGTPDCKASTAAALDAFFVAHPLPASGAIGPAVKIDSINSLADILSTYNDDQTAPCGGSPICPTTQPK